MFISFNRFVSLNSRLLKLKLSADFDGMSYRVLTRSSFLPPMSPGLRSLDRSSLSPPSRSSWSRSGLVRPLMRFLSDLGALLGDISTAD